MKLTTKTLQIPLKNTSNRFNQTTTNFHFFYKKRIFYSSDYSADHQSKCCCFVKIILIHDLSIRGFNLEVGLLISIT